MRRLIIAAMSLALAACGSAGGGIASAGDAAPIVAGAADAAGVPAPATVQERTTVDEKVVTLAARTVDTLALSLSALSKTPLLPPGTPTAQQAARGIDAARDGVNAAAGARTATSYTAALARAQEGIDAVKAIVASIVGGQP